MKDIILNEKYYDLVSKRLNEDYCDLISEDLNLKFDYSKLFLNLQEDVAALLRSLDLGLAKGECLLFSLEKPSILINPKEYLFLPYFFNSVTQIEFQKFKVDFKAYGQDLPEYPYLLCVLIEIQKCIFYLCKELVHPNVSDDFLFKIDFSQMIDSIFAALPKTHLKQNQNSFAVVDYNLYLLKDLFELMYSKYENCQATTSILIAAPEDLQSIGLARKIYKDHFLITDKNNLKISNGITTSFIFDVTGCFYGLFNTEKFTKKLEEKSCNWWQWRITSEGLLEGFGNHFPILRHYQKKWGLIISEGCLIKKLELELKNFCSDMKNQDRQPYEVDQTNEKYIKILWKTSRILAQRKEGGLLLLLNKTYDGAHSERNEKPASVGIILENPFSRLKLSNFIIEQFENKEISKIDEEILADLASVDGAVIIAHNGILLDYGCIVENKTADHEKSDLDYIRGARTKAAMAASEDGLVFKVSEDGPISVYYCGKSLIDVL